MREVHCPECGTKANPGAAACAACGHLLPGAEGDTTKLGVLVARTMVGVTAPGAGAPPIPAPLPEDLPTIVSVQTKAARAAAQVDGAAPAVRVPSQVQQTMLGGVLPTALKEGQPPVTNAPKTGVAGTLLGSPPVRPSAPREMPHELGATIVPQPARPRRANRIGAERLEPDALLVNRDKLARKRIVLPPVRSREEHARLEVHKRRRKALPFIVATIALVAVLIALVIFWRSPAPLSARVRVMPDGHEAIEFTCPTCPDGTKMVMGDITAMTTARLAQLPLVAPLSLGENRLKVALDRPAGGQDETVGVSVHVGYRLRPDLSMLNADKPTLHIAIEALKGAEITLGGQIVKLEDGPKAHAIDVSADCTGSSDEPAMLRRHIPYSVKSPDGVRDEGAVDIAVAIVSLRVDAPGPRVVTESDTFVLSGHTMKGAEVLVAGRPIQVSADGAFAQRMSVSSIGATSIEVRAKIPGMAPRIVPIAVQRVERLEQAAKEFEKEKPVGYTTVALASVSDVGRAVVVAGQIAEVRAQNHQTVYLLDVLAKDGCPKSNEACRVRLVQGAASAAKVGDSITAYGQIGRPSSTTSGAVVPEIQVAFTLPRVTGASPRYEFESR